tara:strand:- start:117 stop:311 length:195 start_codon:yes stop_codon:yes gene_type:complete
MKFITHSNHFGAYPLALTSQKKVSFDRFIKKQLYIFGVSRIELPVLAGSVAADIQFLNMSRVKI